MGKERLRRTMRKRRRRKGAEGEGRAERFAKVFFMKEGSGDLGDCWVAMSRF